MQKRNLDNKRLDDIGRKLIRSDSVRPVDVDKIVANSSLFDGVRARIAQNDAVVVRPTRLRWNLTAVASTAVAVAAVVFTLSTFQTDAPQLVRRDVSISPGAGPVASFTKSDGI